MIHHVNFKVTPDMLGECEEFYELLGFKRIEPPPTLADRAIWMANGDSQIHLQYSVDGVEVVVDPVAVGDGHVAIVIPDYDFALGALGRIQWAIEPRAEHWGSPRCYVNDPMGNRLELTEFAP